MTTSLITKIEWEKVYKETIDLFKNYLRVDTTNPPGNEILAARFFGEILDREGIPYKIYESQPGRGSILARIPGSGDKKPVVMMNHMDVVPAEPDKWDHPHLEAQEHDGFIYARGAQDMKALGTLEFMALLLLKRSGVKLNRDVIFLGCADEERGGTMGIGWLMDNVPELSDIDFCQNEGGSISKTDTGALIYKVAFSEKVPSWFRLTSRGPAGHGSVPTVDHCNVALVKAMEGLVNWKTKIDIIPMVRSYISSVAPSEKEPLRSILMDIDNSVKDPERMQTIERDYPQYNAQIRDTLSLNIIHSGSKINVIPSEGYAEFDVRLIPGHTREGFIAQVREMLKDLPVEVEMKVDRPAACKVPESEDSDFYCAVKQMAQEMTPGAVVTPALMAGASDSQYFRIRGIPSYGFGPLILGAEEKKRVHGHNERMSLENMRFGVKAQFRIMEILTM